MNAIPAVLTWSFDGLDKSLFSRVRYSTPNGGVVAGKGRLKAGTPAADGDLQGRGVAQPKLGRVCQNGRMVSLDTGSLLDILGECLPLRLLVLLAHLEGPGSGGVAG